MIKPIDKKAMGQRLKELRIAKGKTISQVACETGLGESALRNYEGGIRIPRFVAMFNLAEYYGKSVDSIFLGSMTRHVSFMKHDREVIE